MKQISLLLQRWLIRVFLPSSFMHVKDPKNLKYRSDIDGLRALAVLSVLFFHLGSSLFSGGFVGVDIFFVISGFLITQLIRDEIQRTDSFRFSHFYVRRIRRLFPALIFTLALCLVAASLLFSARFFDNFSLSLLSALFSVSNIYFWRSSNYFSAGSEFEPLLHTWSLSVEEQFYLLWPVLLFFLLKKFPKYGPVVFLSFFLLVSLGINAPFKDRPELIFYLLPFRIFEFCIGALLVWGIEYRPANKKTLEILVILGLALIAYSIFVFTKNTVFPSYNALIPCIGAALLIYAGKTKYSGKILDNKFCVGVGLISYSLYLVHWPIIVFYKYYQNIDVLSFQETFVLSSISILAAYLMWRFIEQPFRTRKVSLTKTPAQDKSVHFFVGSLLSFILIGAGAVYVHADNGVKGRVSANSEFENTGYGGGNYPWEGIVGDMQSAKALIVYGDSHSKQYLSALDAFGQSEHIRIINIGHPACMSLPGVTNIYQGRIHQSCIDMLERLKLATQGNDFPVLIAYRYTKTIADWKGRSEINFKDGKRYTDQLIQGLGALQEVLGRNRKIVIFGNVPSANLKMGYMDCITRPVSKLDCHDKFLRGEGEFSNLRLALNEFQTHTKNVMFLDVYEPLCDKQYCFVTRDKKLYYSDHAHLTADGAKLVVDGFSNQILSFIN